MMVFYLRGIDTTLGWFFNGIHTLSKLIKDWILQQSRDGFIHIIGDVRRASSWIGNKLLLIEALGNIQSLVSGIAMLGVCGLL